MCWKSKRTLYLNKMHELLLEIDELLNFIEINTHEQSITKETTSDRIRKRNPKVRYISKLDLLNLAIQNTQRKIKEKETDLQKIKELLKVNNL